MFATGGRVITTSSILILCWIVRVTSPPLLYLLACKVTASQYAYDNCNLVKTHSGEDKHSKYMTYIQTNLYPLRYNIC